MLETTFGAGVLNKALKNPKQIPKQKACKGCQPNTDLPKCSSCKPAKQSRHSHWDADPGELPPEERQLFFLHGIMDKTEIGITCKNSEQVCDLSLWIFRAFTPFSCRLILLHLPYLQVAQQCLLNSPVLSVFCFPEWIQFQLSPFPKFSLASSPPISV